MASRCLMFYVDGTVVCTYVMLLESQRHQVSSRSYKDTAVTYPNESAQTKRKGKKKKRKKKPLQARASEADPKEKDTTEKKREEERRRATIMKLSPAQKAHALCSIEVQLKPPANCLRVTDRQSALSALAALHLRITVRGDSHPMGTNRNGGIDPAYPTFTCYAPRRLWRVRTMASVFGSRKRPTHCGT